MEEISASGTDLRIFAATAYFLPFITLVFGPFYLYYKFRRTNKFVAFHALYNIYLLSIWSIAGVFLPIIISLVAPSLLPAVFLVISGTVILLWAYGLMTCAFGETPKVFRDLITAQVARYYGH